MFRKTLHLFSVHANTFYKRPLPETLIAFSSAKGKQIFREALDLGGMASYFNLAEQFHTQSEPARMQNFCKI